MVTLKQNVKWLFTSKKFYWSLLFLFFGIALNWAASVYLSHNNYPVLDDTFFKMLPFWNCAFASDLIVIISLVFFFSLSFKNEHKMLPYIIFLFAMLQVVRAIFLVLTPFGRPLYPHLGVFGNEGYVNPIFAHGMFPSGHTGATFLAFLIAKKYKLVFLCLSLLVMFFLLLARGHYSVDIFAAVVFVYAIKKFGDNNIAKHFDDGH